LPQSGAWLDAVRQVVAAVRASDVTDLELANGSFSVRVRREALPATTSVSGVLQVGDAKSSLHIVVAPFTGVFYRSPTPSARPYVAEGEWVDADAIIGLVETMKIFNEVTADVPGRIVKFGAESGQLVHAGEVLASIEPGERATAAPAVHP
jgi:acetyl-CoA carboxylase biotin carboxyl carrier protein